MDNSTAKDQINTSDLIEVLRELRDSVRNQTTLLEELLTEHRASRETPKRSHKSSQRSSQSPSSNSNHNGDKGGDASCENNQTTQPVTAELDDRGALARQLSPLLHDRVAFWKVEKELATYLSKTYRYTPPTSLSFIDNMTSTKAQPHRGVAGNNWKYWMPFSIFHVGRVVKFCHRGGHPDYVSPWELRKVKDQLFHIDDIQQQDPLPFSESFMDDQLIIPYSFTPPGSFGGLIYPDRLATTGITQDWSRMHSCLGDLYATPPDSRIPLTFERNELRLKCASGEIDAYLDRICETFKKLDSKGGVFFVADYDIHGQAALYSWWPASKLQGWPFYVRTDDIENSELISINRPSYWKAAGPSLLRELSGLEVAPAVHKRPKYNPDAEDDMLCTLGDDYPPRTRSWYRVIYCQGLADLGESWKSIMDLLIDTSQRRSYFLLDSLIEQAFRLHFTCNSIPKRGNPFKETWKPFHITWHAIVPAGQQRRRGQSWKHGRLYGTEDDLIYETAFTVAIIPPERVMLARMDSIDLADDIGYWTILLLTSSDNFIDVDRPNHGLHLIQQGFAKAVNAWEDLDGHFRRILDTYDTVLNPEEHDRLLFDDDTLSRSRRFFWAMDSLEVFIPEIKNTILEWEYFWEAREPAFRIFEVDPMGRNSVEIAEDEKLPPRPFPWINYEVDKILSHIGKLKEYQARFEAYQTRTRTLREGLFNASSVIESRAATRLGENVKLLTYVSIFYLPLAFCAGIWSINESYGGTSLVITSVLVAAGTYFIVGNLENTIGALKAIYRAFKRPIVDRMAKDDDQIWSERGVGFQSFQPRREIVKPSEWYVARYWVVEILRNLKVRRETPEASRETNEHVDPSRGERSHRIPIPLSESNTGDGGVNPEPQLQSQFQAKVGRRKGKAMVDSPV